MNDQKVCKMVRNVNYVKPEVEMVEIEIEGSLLLTASPVGDVRFGANSSGGAGNTVQGAKSSGRVTLGN